MQAYFKSVTIKIACNKLHAQLSTGAMVMSFVLFYMSYTVHPFIILQVKARLLN